MNVLNSKGQPRLYELDYTEQPKQDQIGGRAWPRHVAALSAEDVIGWFSRHAAGIPPRDVRNALDYLRAAPAGSRLTLRQTAVKEPITITRRWLDETRITAALARHVQGHDWEDA